LHGGYVGDGFPLCVGLPRRGWLHKGAKFLYRGPSLTSTLEESFDSFLTLDDGSSALFQALCGDPNGHSTGRCALSSVVRLPKTLSCTGLECEVESPRLFRLVGAGNLSEFFEWARPSCVELAFFADAKVVTRGKNGRYDRCADPSTAAAGGCCSTTAGTRGMCKFALERVSYATGAARCAAVEAGVGVVCPSSDAQYRVVDGKDPLGCGYDSGARYWTSAPCQLRAQVTRTGWVAPVHEPYGDTEAKHPSFALDNPNAFRVAWDGNEYPTAAANCFTAATACVVHADTCVCDVAVKVDVVFNEPPAAAAEVQAACHIGHLCPETYPAGTYLLLSPGDEVNVYQLAANPAAGSLNTDVIFQLKNGSACYANRRSTVYVGDEQGGGGGGKEVGGFSFRNAPHFVSIATPTAADAEAETEALLDHLLFHPNTAPFVAHRLIQRFTTSNPSPRYVSVVADAFRTGMHGGHTYSGTYGDLGATVAAVLSDREARATTARHSRH